MNNEVRPNLINGEWLPAGNGFETRNPSDTDEVIGHFSCATHEQVSAAVAAARTAFPEWSRSDMRSREAALRGVAEELRARAEELGELLSREEGKPLQEGIGEVRRAAEIFEFYSGEGLRLTGETAPAIRPSARVEVCREPVGVVALVTPWNFPVALPAWKIAPALVYGNCVVLKPSEVTPASAWALAEIVSRSGIPAGVFNLVMGDRATGAALVADCGVDAISFTGSVETGRKVAQAGISHMARLQLEMGGKNPLLILDDAVLDLAVDCALRGAFFSTGQRCTASSRLIVTKAIHNRFVDALVDRMGGLVVGHALERETTIGPVVSEAQLERDLRYLDIGRAEGARLQVGGRKIERVSNGYFLEPALFTETHSVMRINQDEIFGPIAAVIAVDDYDEGLEVANATRFGLTAGIITSSLSRAEHFRKHIEAGVATVNMATVGLDFHVPFGGRKASSYGPREQGPSAREFFTETRTAYIDPGPAS